MGLQPLASIDDLEQWLGSRVDPARATAVLRATSALVRATAGRAWVSADGTPDADLSDMQLESAYTVVLTVAARVYQNPKGTTQQIAGPFQETVSAWAALGLELTDTEKSMLVINSQGIPGLGSIRVVAPRLARGSHFFDPWWWWWQDWDPDAIPTGPV